MKLKSLSLLIATITSTSLFSAPVDLNSWSVQDYSSGAGDWEVQDGGDSVFQSINGQPTVFLSNESALGTDIQGTIKVETGGDDDFVGFVLGFDSGDFADPLADYLLIDWKQGNQDVADAGLAVSQVTGVASSANPDFWAHTGAVNELARGATLGTSGWADNVEYLFNFIFTTTSLQVFVDGVEEINIAGDFSGGNLGFYNYSQSSVRYAGFTQDSLPPTGVPDGGATVGLLGLALAGLSLAAARRR